MRTEEFWRTRKVWTQEFFYKNAVGHAKTILHSSRHFVFSYQCNVFVIFCHIYRWHSTKATELLEHSVETVSDNIKIAVIFFAFRSTQHQCCAKVMQLYKAWTSFNYVFHKLMLELISCSKNWCWNSSGVNFINYYWFLI